MIISPSLLLTPVAAVRAGGRSVTPPPDAGGGGGGQTVIRIVNAFVTTAMPRGYVAPGDGGAGEGTGDPGASTAGIKLIYAALNRAISRSQG